MLAYVEPSINTVSSKLHIRDLHYDCNMKHRICAIARSYSTKLYPLYTQTHHAHAGMVTKRNRYINPLNQTHRTSLIFLVKIKLPLKNKRERLKVLNFKFFLQIIRLYRMNAIKLITNDNDVPKRSGFTLIMMVRIVVKNRSKTYPHQPYRCWSKGECHLYIELDSTSYLNNVEIWKSDRNPTCDKGSWPPILSARLRTL